MEIKVKKLHPDAKLPTKGTEGSAYYDVYALEDTRVYASYTRAVRTGVSLECPTGYVVDIRPRSSLSMKGLSIANSPGTLDSDYRGELLILVMQYRGFSFMIRKGNRIAQIGLLKVEPIEFKEVDELSETRRGSSGIGSTGR